MSGSFDELGISNLRKTSDDLRQQHERDAAEIAERNRALDNCEHLIRELEIERERLRAFVRATQEYAANAPLAGGPQSNADHIALEELYNRAAELLNARRELGELPEATPPAPTSAPPKP